MRETHFCSHLNKFIDISCRDSRIEVSEIKNKSASQTHKGTIPKIEVGHQIYCLRGRNMGFPTTDVKWPNGLNIIIVPVSHFKWKLTRYKETNRI